MANLSHSLSTIRDSLSKELRNESEFSFVNTRLILRTGIDLRRYDEVSAERLENAVRVLRDMGYLGGE